MKYPDVDKPTEKKPNGKSKIIEWFDLIWVGSRRCYIEIYNLKMVKYQGQNWAFHDISLNLKLKHFIEFEKYEWNNMKKDEQNAHYN